MKKCTGCKKIKELNEFGKNRSNKDGYLFRCKDCRNKYVREHYKENPSIQKKANKRFYERHPDKAKEYYDKNKDKIAEAFKRRVASNPSKYREENNNRQREWVNKQMNDNWIAYKEKRRIYKATERAKHPEKIKAGVEVRKAIKKGILIRANCIKCNNHKSQAHHEDYSKPLEVTWLCHKHHQELHRIRRECSIL